MPDQRCGGGFAVGACHRNNGRGASRLSCRLDHTREQLDIADHFGTCFARTAHDSMRLRMGQGHAGTEDKGGHRRPRPLFPMLRHGAFSGSHQASRFLVVPGKDRSASGLQRADRREPRTRQAEYSDRLACKTGDFDHRRLSAV